MSDESRLMKVEAKVAELDLKVQSCQLKHENMKNEIDSHFLVLERLAESVRGVQNEIRAWRWSFIGGIAILSIIWTLNGKDFSPITFGHTQVVQEEKGN